MKAISEIFSALILTVIILALTGPLLYYFNQVYAQQTQQIGYSTNAEILGLMTKVEVIRLNNNTQNIFIYNYGSISANINEIIINQNKYIENFHLAPDSLVRLSQIVGNTTVDGTIILKINGYYYYF